MEAQRLAEIARRFGLELILEYGSVVSGHTHPHSDVDIGVLLRAPDPALRTLADLVSELGSLRPGRKVDVAVLNRADPLFLKKVTERCRLLHGSPRRLAELKMYAYRRYQDHRRYLPLERECVERTRRSLTSS